MECERRSQSDCVHEQVAKVDCECPLYCRKEKTDEEKEAITKMAVTLTAIRITAMLLIFWFALHKFSGQ